MSKTAVTRFSSIGQYRDIIVSVAKLASKHNEELPVLHFRGLVKLHGTNAAIIYDPSKKSQTDTGIKIQSRNNVYGPIVQGANDQGKEAGHMGFNEFVYRPEVVKLVEEIYAFITTGSTDSTDSTNKTSKGQMIIYGEWAGKGIQRNVAISEFEKGFYIFGIRLSGSSASSDSSGSSSSSSSSDSSETDKKDKKEDKEPQDDDDEIIDLDGKPDSDQWFDIAELKLPLEAANLRVFNLADFESWEIDIDFKDPKASQNKLIEITDKVEKACPVGLALASFQAASSSTSPSQQNTQGASQGASTTTLQNTVGEGVVWQTEYKGHRLLFKVKGTKHSVSKVKTLASVDPEEHSSIQSFIESVVTENRIDQAIHEVGLKKNGTLKMSDMPELLKWVANDVLKEESDTLKASKLEWSKASKPVTQKARTLFMVKLAQA